MNQILNYDFLIKDETIFYEWIDEGYKKGAFIKEECILKEKEDVKEAP